MKTSLLPEGVKFPGTRLTPVHRLPPLSGRRNLFYRCICDCGAVKDIAATGIRRGKQKSCGCYRNDLISARSKTHGISKRDEYFASHNAYARCTDPEHGEFKNYGGRGIAFGFDGPTEMAKWLLENLPRPNKSVILDRIDNDSGYFPENLRWVSQKQSHRNRRITRRITISGATKTLMEWAEYYGIKPTSLDYRIRAGFPMPLWFFKSKITPRVLSQYAAAEVRAKLNQTATRE